MGSAPGRSRQSAFLVGVALGTVLAGLVGAVALWAWQDPTSTEVIAATLAAVAVAVSVVALTVGLFAGDLPDGH